MSLLGLSLSTAGDVSHAEPQQHVSSAADDTTTDQPGRRVGCAHTVQSCPTSLVSSRAAWQQRTIWLMSPHVGLLWESSVVMLTSAIHRREAHAAAAAMM
jgi:hypothetical protein